MPCSFTFTRSAAASPCALWLAALLLPAAVLGAEKDETPPPAPAELAAVLEELPEDKREYLMEEGESFAGTWAKLYTRLAGKTAAEVEAFVDALKHLEEAAKFNPDTDMAAIPLNTESDEFNSWKLMRPKALNRKREPGPIHLSYYAAQRGGIATFANAPLAIYPED
ncbi:MAG: hypothetical protein V2I24_13100, partial [Halieaceae bacterium]|nr:hypothetical protein [Halieaceae bacterium]